jgi:succinate-acetate transporter protein
MAVGNTFGATALSSYGGFWISYAIIFTPGGFDIIGAYKDKTGAVLPALENAVGFYLAGWFIFTTLMLLCTLRSTVAFFLLFFFLDLAFLFLMIGKFQLAHADSLTSAGGYFGLFAAFMAWYNALAGIADDR